MKPTPSKYSRKQLKAGAYNIGYRDGMGNGRVVGGIIMFISMTLCILVAHYL
jgi:hypothetical protein